MQRISANRGFSLIEALVAIAVLLVGIVSPMTLAQRSLSAAILAKDQTTATYLAQEGVEYIRNFRDTNVLRGNAWNNGFTACAAPNGCTVDAAANIISPSGDPQAPVACTGTCSVLKFDTTSGLYGYSVGTNTAFRRTVVITPLVTDGGNEIQVRVTVDWQTGSQVRSFTVEERLFSWQGS